MIEKLNPGSKPKPKRKFIQVRVSEKEKIRIKNLAKDAGLTLTELMLQAADRVRPWTAPDRKLEQEKIRQVAKIGNNLNQIARAVNTQGIINHELDILSQLKSIQEELRKALFLEGPDAH